MSHRENERLTCRRFPGRSMLDPRLPLVACQALAAILFLASSAQAHPGHGSDGGSFSVTHYLTSPLHWLGMLAVALLVAAGASLMSRLWRRGLSGTRSQSTADRLPS